MIAPAVEPVVGPRLGSCRCGAPATTVGPSGDPYHYCDDCALELAQKILSAPPNRAQRRAAAKAARRKGRRR